MCNFYTGGAKEFRWLASLRVWIHSHRFGLDKSTLHLVMGCVKKFRTHKFNILELVVNMQMLPIKLCFHLSTLSQGLG